MQFFGAVMVNHGEKRFLWFCTKRGGRETNLLRSLENHVIVTHMMKRTELHFWVVRAEIAHMAMCGFNAPPGRGVFG